MNNDQKKPANEQPKDKSAQLNAKIKETWGKLSDADIAQYGSGKKEQFFTKVKEQYQVSPEDAQKKVTALEEACGCGTSNKAA
jgi:uncharacterized protein YjbJ (UPF0337 family)